MRALQDCYGSLTRREREVMALVVSGLLNKQVGGELGISEITVKAHRGMVRLAENPDVNVLLLEAGGDDDVPEVMEAGRWPMNLGSGRHDSLQHSCLGACEKSSSRIGAVGIL